MAKTIYTDQETEKILGEIKEKDPEFNLSAWMKVKLKDFGGVTEDTLVELSNQLEEAKIEESKALAKQNYIRQKISEVQMKDANEKQRIEYEKHKKHTKEAERYKSFVGIIPYVASELTPDQIEEYAQEFALEDIDVHEFMEQKRGNKDKPEPNPPKEPDELMKELTEPKPFVVDEK